MATINDIALAADVDTIAPVVDCPTKSEPPISHHQSASHTDEQQPQIAEPLHLDEGVVNVRTKFCTLAIVSALYVVLFIAALDQTIIA